MNDTRRIVDVDELLKYMKDTRTYDIVWALQYAPIIQTCEDCISREAVIEDVIKCTDMNEDTMEVLENKVKALPSVTPERPKGKWLHIYKSDIACECSVCHIQMPITEYFHYCPNCGANMSGGEEDEDRKSL